MHVLVRDVSKKLVFNQRSPQCSAGRVAVHLRNFVVGRKVGVLLVEKWRRVQPVSAAMNLATAVEGIGARGGAHVDMSTAGRALLRVVHRGIDADLLNSLRGRRRDRLTDRQVDGRRALNWRRAGAGRIRHAGVVHDAGRCDLAGALAVEQVAGVDPIDQKTVAGIALSVGPDGLVAQAAVDPGSTRQFSIYTGRQNGEPGETACWQRDSVDL